MTPMIEVPGSEGTGHDNIRPSYYEAPILLPGILEPQSQRVPGSSGSAGTVMQVHGRSKR